MRRLLLALLLLPSLAGLAGCFGTTPPSRFYVLSASPEKDAGAPAAAPVGALGVMPTRIPAYLDRPQIVTFLGDNAVAVEEFSRWAEPLSAGVTRVVAQDLAAKLPRWRVLAQPWDPTVPLKFMLVVQIEAFGWDAKGDAHLEATWTLLTTYIAPPVARGNVHLHRKIPRAGADAGVATMSELLEEMTREVATAVQGAPEP